MKHLLDAGAEALELTIRRKGNRGTWPPMPPDRIRQLRTNLRCSQRKFCETYGFDLSSLKSWETGRRVPDSSNTLLLLLVESEPKRMQKFLQTITAVVTPIGKRNFEKEPSVTI